MTDREELRRLIDVIEKASASVQLDQAIEDIKTFANTTSFLANKLETRLKGGDVKAKSSQSHVLGKPLQLRQFPSPMCQAHNRLRQTLQLAACPQLHQLQHRRRITIGSSRRARRDQYLAAEHCGCHTASVRGL